MPAMMGNKLLLTYSVQHPHQASGLFTSKFTPCAQLSRVSCTFRFGNGAHGSVGTRCSMRVRNRGRKPNDPSQTLAEQPYLQEHRLRLLVHTGIYLLLGVRKQMPLVRFLESMESPSLLNIAPAVFSVPYLQV